MSSGRFPVSASTMEALWVLGYVGAWQNKACFGPNRPRDVEMELDDIERRIRTTIHAITHDASSSTDLALEVYRRLNAALIRHRVADLEAMAIEIARAVAIEWVQSQADCGRTPVAL